MGHHSGAEPNESLVSPTPYFSRVIGDNPLHTPPNLRTPIQSVDSGHSREPESVVPFARSHGMCGENDFDAMYSQHSETHILRRTVHSDVRAVTQLVKGRSERARRASNTASPLLCQIIHCLFISKPVFYVLSMHFGRAEHCSRCSGSALCRYQRCDGDRRLPVLSLDSIFEVKP